MVSLSTNCAGWLALVGRLMVRRSLSNWVSFDAASRCEARRQATVAQHEDFLLAAGDGGVRPVVVRHDRADLPGRGVRMAPGHALGDGLAHEDDGTPDDGEDHPAVGGAGQDEGCPGRRLVRRPAPTAPASPRGRRGHRTEAGGGWRRHGRRHGRWPLAAEQGLQARRGAPTGRFGRSRAAGAPVRPVAPCRWPSTRSASKGRRTAAPAVLPSRASRAAWRWRSAGRRWGWEGCGRRRGERRWRGGPVAQHAPGVLRGEHEEVGVQAYLVAQQSRVRGG